MLISEVTEQIGLSKKAIRFYEEKGLIKVARKENGYREYSEGDVLALNKIKFLRMCGISVSDIKLLFENMVTLDDLLQKRKKEIESEHDLHFSQFDNISQMIDSYKKNRFNLTDSFEETSVSNAELSDKLAVGIDIGSTTISATVIDTQNNIQVESYTVSNGAEIIVENPAFYEQDPLVLCDKAIRLIEIITDNYKNIKAIGVTGQMHGIVYIDKNGNAVSNLITWQDKRADENLANGYSYCDKIFEITGNKVYTGFGMATHYYNCINNMVPPTAHSFCSIMDYLVMKLTDTTDPVLHSSVAASFGLFDIKGLKFKTDAISKLGIDNVTLPKVTDDFYIVGRYKNIPVSVAIGDNQASFIGAVDN
ncbi:MAG: FGGY family carbohydrate kinase, partial [Acutalibacteraceae bacterium]|nr:FGGY family carbohydrate kinase [Acutalibacteraceae bacterium]